MSAWASVPYTCISYLRNKKSFGSFVEGGYSIVIIHSTVISVDDIPPPQNVS